MKNCLEIKDLCKSYGDFALDHVNLTIPGGTIMGLIGENGAGKTTTIKCILNLIRRDSGTITILGSLRPKDLKRILGPVYPTWDDNLYADYLKKFKLPEEKLIKEFSRGMKMKLSLAAALAHQPRLLILDEATAGLDPVVRDEILDEFLSFICDEDHAILISSHITSDLEKAADYITYIHEGKIVLSEAKDDILDRYGRVGCSAADLRAIDPSDLLRVRQGPFGCEALVTDRGAFHKKYPKLMVEKIHLEDIMLFVGKGKET